MKRKRFSIEQIAAALVAVTALAVVRVTSGFGTPRRQRDSFTFLDWLGLWQQGTLYLMMVLLARNNEHLIGATSAIATAVARRYAARKARIGLIGRRAEALDALAADLRVRGAAEVETWVLDANDIARHAERLDAAWRRFDGVDHALVAHGVLPDQAECQASVASALASFDANARSVLALLTDLANRFECQGSGAIGVISSPAGDRGRASNYVYGAAKAAVTNLASGLRHRLASKGVRVVTILPGFVDTPMTASFPKGPLWAAPEKVAADIDRALAKGFGAVYTPWFWRWIMLAIRHVPERLFVRTRL